jgi:hypothetical protein
MQKGLVITVIDPDPDYLGIDIRAWNERFAGSTFIFAGRHELAELATLIEGFPARIPDERQHVFGSKDPRVAGGYCCLHFRTIDSTGHAVIDVVLEDDDGRHSSGAASLCVPVEAAEIATFVRHLRAVNNAQMGTAAVGEAA